MFRLIVKTVFLTYFFTNLHSKCINKKVFKNRPYDVTYFELENGLKVYLVDIKKGNDIKVKVVYNVGSKDDPRDNTGLAHYLEHLLFNGTSKIGSLNFEKEKPILDKISDLFEKLKETDNEKKKANITKQIIKNNIKASEYAISEEFQKIMKSYNCYSNAYTSVDETTFETDTNSKYFEKTIIALSEQLNNPCFRNFYNELQVVYEEYIKQNENSNYIIINTAKNELYKNHPYKNPIIGYPEHLKKPSIKALENFYKKYYLPNNCTIVIVGDIDFNDCYNTINKYFGNLKKSEIKREKFEEIGNIKEKKEKTVYNEVGECASYFYRCKKTSIQNLLKTSFSIKILKDYLNSQKLDHILYSTCYCIDFKHDYLVNIQIENQDRHSIEKAKEELFETITKFYNGDFDSRLIEKCKNIFIKNIRDARNNIDTTVDELSTIIRNEYDYQEFIDTVYNVTENINKSDICNIIKSLFTGNYVLINKQTGNRNYEEIKPSQLIKINLNEDKRSKFREDLDNMKYGDIKIQSYDFNKDINKIKITDNVNAYFSKKNNKKLFNIIFKYNYGTTHNTLLTELNRIADYVKTKSKTKNEFINELGVLSTTLSIIPNENSTFIEISGLSENLRKSLKIIGDFITKMYICDDDLKYIKKRLLEVNKENKIAKKIYKNYDKIILGKDKINFTTTKDILNLFKSILTSKCKIYIDSDYEQDKIINEIKNSGLISKCKNKNKINTLEMNEFGKSIILVQDARNYQKVYCSILRYFDKNNKDLTTIFLLSSLIKNTLYNVIRNNGLSYDISSHAFLQGKSENKHLLCCNFTTQPNKFENCLSETMTVLENLKFLNTEFNTTKKSLKDKYESEKLDNKELLIEYINNRDLCIDTKKTNVRNEIQNTIKTIEIKDLENFYTKNIKNKPKIIYIVANIEDLDFNSLSKYGEIIVL